MRNRELWTSSKFVEAGGKWVGSPDVSKVGRGSRFIMDIVASTYNQAIKKHAKGRLLDLGCGEVPLYGMYKDLVDNNTCVDWRKSIHQNHHVDNFVDLNGPLPFQDHSFDTILTTDVLEHIREPEICWREMSRVLAPGGKLILCVPFLYWQHEEPYDYFRYTSHKLKDYCEIHGLQILELEPYGGGLEVILDISGKHIARHAWLSAMHLALTKLLMRLSPLRALSDDQKNEFPLGFCLVALKNVPPKSSGQL